MLLMPMLIYIQNNKYTHIIILSVSVCCPKELWMIYEATSGATHAFVSSIFVEEGQHPQEPTWRTCSWS